MGMPKSLVVDPLPTCGPLCIFEQLLLIGWPTQISETKLLEAPALFLFVQRKYKVSNDWRRATIHWIFCLSLSAKSYKVKCLQSNISSTIASQSRGHTSLEITA